MDLEGTKNTSMITALILLLPHMHIRPTRLLKDDALNAEFDVDERLCIKLTSLD